MAEAAQPRSEWIEYQSRGATIRAYLGLPAGAGPWPGIVMIHENPGVTDHRMDVTRRLAGAGYVTITPDLFSRIGGKPPSGASDVERRQNIDIALPDDQVFDDLMNGYQFLKNRDGTIQSRIALYGYLHGRRQGLLYDLPHRCVPLLRQLLRADHRQGGSHTGRQRPLAFAGRSRCLVSDAISRRRSGRCLPAGSCGAIARRITPS